MLSTLGMRLTPTSRAIAASTLFLPLSSCGARSELNMTIVGAPASGGAIGNAGATSSGGTFNNVGTSSTGTTLVGCPGLPVIKPTAPNAASCLGGCGNLAWQGPLQLHGITATVLESFVSIDPSCSVPTPACIPLIAFNSGLGYRDPVNLSVWFALPDGTGEMFPNVKSTTECTTSSGWYFDDSEKPSTIKLCPCSCDRVKAIQGILYLVDFPVICIG